MVNQEFFYRPDIWFYVNVIMLFRDRLRRQYPPLIRKSQWPASRVYAMMIAHPSTLLHTGSRVEPIHYCLFPFTANYRRIDGEPISTGFPYDFLIQLFYFT